MSLQQFQQALAALTIDPALAARVHREGEEALSAFALTALERERLVSVCRQPGMSLNCTLARGNRFAPIVDVYPLVCALLGPRLRDLLDEFWDAHRPRNYQLSGEEDAFAGFLLDRIDRGALVQAHLRNVLDYESACWDLIQATRHAAQDAATAEPRLHRIVRFDHDPREVLPPLRRGEMPAPNLAPRAFRLQLVLRGDAIVAEMAADEDAPALQPH